MKKNATLILFMLLVVGLGIVAAFLSRHLLDLSVPDTRRDRYPRPADGRFPGVRPSTDARIRGFPSATASAPIGEPRKFAHRPPDGDAEARRPEPRVPAPRIAAPSPLVPPAPALRDFDCEPYGGDFDIFDAGAGIDFLLHRGALCLELARPARRLDRDQTLRYTVDGVDIDACDLEPYHVICLELDIGIRAAGWPSHGEPPGDSLLALHSNLLVRWHYDPPSSPHQTNTVSVRDATHAPRGPARRTEPAVRHIARGTDPAVWFSDLGPAARAEYPEFAPGIDLACYADDRRMELVFTLWPGADPEHLLFTLDGSEGFHLRGNGNLELSFHCGVVLLRAPAAYRVVEGVPNRVDSRFTVRDGRMGFEIDAQAAFDPARREPALDLLSWLGGAGDDAAYAVTADNRGHLYVAGETTSIGFSSVAAPSAWRPEDLDVFVAKIRISDARVLYTTVLGGQGADRAFALAADALGNVYVCGETASPDFPVTNGLPVSSAAGRRDAFVTRLGPDGRIDGFSTRLGGSGDDRAYAIALDASTNVFVAGETSSADFPATEAHGPSLGRSAAFAVKLDPRHSALRYGIVYGGSGSDAAHALALTPRGEVFIAGETSSRDLPVARAFQPRHGGGEWDGFFALFSPRGDALRLASYFGGSRDDRVHGAAIGLSQDFYLAGETASPDFPVHPAVPDAHAGAWDAFAARLAADGQTLRYASLFGGTDDDRAYAVVPDAEGRAYVAVTTFSTNLVGASGNGAPPHSGSAGHLLRLSPDGSQVQYAASFGGAGDDAFNALAVEGGGAAVAAGVSRSAELPLRRPLQSRLNGESDALVARVLPESRPGPDMRRVPGGGQPGGPAYDFYVSTHPVSNDEFVRFLNDAQTNPFNERGTNLYFDVYGNVWFNPAMQRERDEIFDIHDSRIVYDPRHPLGARYSVTPVIPRMGGSYTNHPVVGVSWYGALKYCNWLTLDSGLGAAERCFREGTNGWSWAPVTSAPTNWARGLFTPRERREWLQYRGYRLPMDNSSSARDPACEHLSVTPAEFARFLNDAQSRPETPAGANMHFDPDGSVWMRPPPRGPEERLFRIDGSGIAYDADAAPGTRYSVAPVPNAEPAAARPVPCDCISWYGAMKYCNWLSLAQRDAAPQRAYTEGPAPRDWRPSTADPDDWSRGRFSRAAQNAWIAKRAFKLPHGEPALSGTTDDAGPARDPGTNSWPNAFNEFLKAASWNGFTNTTYGFGANTSTGRDANYLNTASPLPQDTTPAGFYDGRTYQGVATDSNRNLYGIFDLSGNTDEWLTDFGRAHSTATRACYGSSWLSALHPVSRRFHVPPFFTDNFRGFRVVTTWRPDHLYAIRIPFRICLCGVAYGPGCDEAFEEVERVEPVPHDDPELQPVPDPYIDGILYKPREEPVVEDEEPPAERRVPFVSPAGD